MDRPCFTDYVKGYDTSDPESEYIYNSQLERYCHSLGRYCNGLEKHTKYLEQLNVNIKNSWNDTIDILNTAIIYIAQTEGLPNEVVRDWLFDRANYRKQHADELRKSGEYYTKY